MSIRGENVRFARHFDIAPEAFSLPKIAIELHSDAALHPGNRVAFLLAANLLSRTFERVHVVFPESVEAPRHPWHRDTLGDVVDEIQGTVGSALQIGAPTDPDVVLSIGRNPSVAAPRQVLVQGSSWCAALDCAPPKAEEGTLGSLYAACLGAAQVLLHVLDRMGAPYRPMPPFAFSLLDLLRSGVDSGVPDVFLPETHLVGVGAVGSAAVYALAHLDRVSGTLRLIDNETVDGSNLNRYVLMRRRDIGRLKVDVGAEALRATGIKAEPYGDVFSRYVEVNGNNVGLLLSPVDSEEGRRSLAKALPRRVINAATGGTTLTISTHGFADGKACLHCLYMPDLNRASPEETMAAHMGLSPDLVRELVQTNAPVGEELVLQIEGKLGVKRGTWACRVGLPISSFYVKAVCGDADIRLPIANVIAPLSFISAAAGILLAAELVKSSHPQLGKWALDNYFRVDMLHPPSPAFRGVRRQDPSGKCICHDPDYLAVYSQKFNLGQQR